MDGIMRLIVLIVIVAVCFVLAREDGKRSAYRQSLALLETGAAGPTMMSCRGDLPELLRERAGLPEPKYPLQKATP